MKLHQRWPLLSLATITLAVGSWAAGCAGGTDTTDFSSSSSNGSGGQGGTSSGIGGEGGQGAGTSSGTGGSTGPCAVDCTQIQAPACQVAQCNAQTGQCEVVADVDGTTCDDGVFCTVDDACLAGICQGGPANDCGISAPQCTEIVCDEQSQTCSTSPAQNGDPCQDPNDLCMKGATCNNGLCTGGAPEDCFFSPVPDDCHVAECNPQNGQCEPVVGNEGGPCADPNDLCTVNKTCASGVCQGGDPKNCSHLTVGCNMGVCDTNTGICSAQAVGNGQPCDDLDPCTTGEICNSGTCAGGSAVVTCQAGDYCCPSNCNENNDLDCASCDWNPSAFPIAYQSNNSVGDMAFDQNCNLYWSADGGEVFKAPHNTNQVQTLHDFGTLARGLAFNPNDNMLYVAAQDTIYRISTTGANPTTLPGTTISSYYNGMEVAPGSWGNYGGHLIVAHNSGTIYAVNPAGGAPVSVGSQSGTATDVVFDYQSGTLYVSYYQSNGVYTLSPTGQFSPFASGLTCDVDGLAIDEGQTIFAACGGTDTLYRLTIPGGTPTLIGSATLSGGWAPVGMIYDGLDNLMVMEDGEFVQVYTP